MKLSEIIEKLALTPGTKATREEWQDENTYILVRDEKLLLHRSDDNQDHLLVITTGDIFGIDWVFI